MSQISDYFIISGLADKHDAFELKSALSRLSGVKSVAINGTHSRLTVDYDDSGTSKERIVNVVRDMGCALMPDSGNNTLT